MWSDRKNTSKDTVPDEDTADTLTSALWGHLYNNNFNHAEPDFKPAEIQLIMELSLKPTEFVSGMLFHLNN